MESNPDAHLVFHDEDVSFYLINVSGEFTFHSDIRCPITVENRKKLRHLMDCLIVSLSDKGWNHLDTWVYADDEPNIKFSEAFGFNKTGVDKLVKLGDVTERFAVLRLNFPTE